MPSTLRRTQQRALTFSKSIASAVKSKLCGSSFSDKQETRSPINDDHPVESPPPPNKISRPRHLRRAPDPALYYERLHFIHRLPVEILAHIFVLGSECDYMLPITVSHVCHAWRQIAMQTPSVWRRISLNSKAHMWYERIQRARACSLDIQLLPYTMLPGGLKKPQFLDQHTVQWYMHMILPHIKRWRSLEIVFSNFAPYLWNSALSECCSRSSRARAPVLEELSLLYRWNDDTKEFCLFDGHAPRLRRVTLDGIRLTWLPSLFGNLTFLDYTHHGFTTGNQAVSEVLSLLAVSSRLLELRILFPQNRTPASSNSHSDRLPQAVLLPHLSRLYLRAEGPDIPFELAHLVALLSTPSLTFLRLIDHSCGYHPFPNLKSFFYMYALPPSLRVLRIDYGWYDPRMVSPAVQALPLLKQIVVRGLHAPDRVLNVSSRNGKGSTWKDGDPHRRFHVHRLDIRYLQK